MAAPQFAEALAAELIARGMTQSALAAAVGVKQNTVSRWVAVDGFAPDPDRVFAIEAALSMVPGALSRHLGYLPVDTAGHSCSILDSISTAPELEPWQRDALVAIYGTFVTAPAAPGAKRLAKRSA